jgi:hypothetical protein
MYLRTIVFEFKVIQSIARSLKKSFDSNTEVPRRRQQQQRCSRKITAKTWRKNIARSTEAVWEYYCMSLKIALTCSMQPEVWQVG